MRGFEYHPEEEVCRLPRPAAVSVTPAGFVVCPPALPGGCAAQSEAIQALYQLALEQAQAVVRPSLPERDLAAVWN